MDTLFLTKTLIFSVATVVNLLLALAVYRNNPRSITNRIFGLLSLVIVCWMTANYLSLLPSLLDSSLWLIRLSIFFAVAMSALFLLFARAIPNQSMRLHSPHIIIFGILTGITMVMTLSPLVFKSIVINDGSPNPVPGPGIGLFTIVSTAYSASAIYLLLRKISSSHGIAKDQLRFIIYGIAIMLGLIIVTILIPVILFKFNTFVSFIPLYTIIFLGMTTIAIVRHRLFDIRAAVARSVAYLLSLGFIGFMYGSVIFSISSLFETEQQFESLQRAFYIGFALITALVYPSTKRFFDRLTNKIFYRDAYDPEQLLDNLNRALVTQVDLEPLLQGVAVQIETSIKADYCAFVIRETSYFPERIIGSSGKNFEKDEIQLLHNITPQIHSHVIVTEDLGDDYRELKHLLEKYNIEILARLVTTVKYDVEGIGYLMLGPKKSGNLYTQQDENTISIISNELVIAIQNALRFEEIENFNITLQEKVDHATRELRKTNEKLKALDETKDEFISMASHQLRTPLTSVKGYLSMVLEGDAGEISEMQHKLLDQAYVSSQRMVYLIADLLNVSRLRTGKFVIEAVPTNLADLVEGEITQLKGTAKSRNITLTYEKPTDFPALLLDETKLRQVVMNFADNAIYYTRSGGNINIELEDKGQTIEFRVADDGLGVPKAEQHHLFTKFYRADNARKARPDGTGLGLFMAKKVIIAQGGSLIFKSTEGKGSTFGFSFEKAKLEPPKTTS